MRRETARGAPYTRKSGSAPSRDWLTVQQDIRIREASTELHAAVRAVYDKCGYRHAVKAQDIVLAAMRRDEPIGVVRLCHEDGVMVLRGMHVLPEHQRQGVGCMLLDECRARLGDSPCYCIPWRHLQAFYAKAGFIRLDAEDAPRFLRRRHARYLGEGHDVILMRTGG